MDPEHGEHSDERLADEPAPPAADPERPLRDLVAAQGFAVPLSIMAGLARRWSEHPEVDARSGAELRLLGRRLDALAQDVRTSTCLN